MARLTLVSIVVASFLQSQVATLCASPRLNDGARALGAISAACLAYVVLMLVSILVAQPNPDHAAMVIAVGMAGSTMIATLIASRVLPRRFRDHGMLACVMLGLAYPICVAAGSEPTEPVQMMLSLYLSGTALGGVCGLVRAGWGPLTALG